MKPDLNRTCTAFAGHQMIATGPVAAVARTVKERLAADETLAFLVFDDETSAPVELDLRGSLEDVERRLVVETAADASDHQLAAAGRGRPKLGVVAREVTLLPRHWQWLATQRGGASATLRQLVEEAKRRSAGKDLGRKAQEVTYKFMAAVAGDLPAYEEALRALYAKDQHTFDTLIAGWPPDVRRHAALLASNAWQG